MTQYTLGIFSPSWWLEKEKLEQAKQHLEQLGFGVVIHEQNYITDKGQVAGNTEERCDALYELLENPEIDGVMFAAGGYGALQMLPALDYERIKKPAKPVIGYSDGTALLNAIYAKCGKISYHSTMPVTIAARPHNNTDESLIDVLLQGNTSVDFAGFSKSKLLQKGQAEGVLLGGNMTVFEQLLGTPYMPKTENIILLMEEASNEKINELDKKLLHLSNAGYLNNVRGLILAGMEDLSDNDKPFGFNVGEIVSRYLPSDIPVITNTPCGHGESIITLPIGAKCKIDGMKLSIIN